MEVLERIQAWHKAQLERGRDPALGVRIETLRERPGWSVQIDLSGTPLSGLKLAPYREGATDRDWLAYRIKEDRFEGIGDPTKLQALLFAFLDLADRTAAETALRASPSASRSSIRPSLSASRRGAICRDGPTTTMAISSGCRRSRAAFATSSLVTARTRCW